MKKLLFFILLYTGAGWPQPAIPFLEHRLDSLTTQLLHAQSRLDSLDSQLEKASRRLEQEKSASPRDNNRLRTLMANGLSLSREAKKQHDAVASLREETGKLKSLLDREYSSAIDSLTDQKKKDSGEKEKKVLDQKILALMEKRLMVMPPMQTLTFDPHRLQTIRPDTVTDSLEENIYRDYLTNALASIDKNLRHIKARKTEFTELETLQKKTGEFLADIDEERDFGLSSHTYTASGQTESKPPPFGGPRVEETDQIQSIVILLKQLDPDFGESNAGAWHSPIDTTQIVYSRQDYIRLLDRAENILNSYQHLIQKKLQQFK